jgi:hypothetical protein
VTQGQGSVVRVEYEKSVCQRLGQAKPVSFRDVSIRRRFRAEKELLSCKCGQVG